MSNNFMINFKKKSGSAKHEKKIEIAPYKRKKKNRGERRRNGKRRVRLHKLTPCVNREKEIVKPRLGEKLRPCETRPKPTRLRRNAKGLAGCMRERVGPNQICSVYGSAKK